MASGCPSFICALPVPLTITSVSFAVCQCHGTEQPGANFSRITDAPFVGSPCNTESVMHVGRPAMLPNLLVDGETTPMWPMSCAATRDVSPTSNTNTLRNRLSKTHPLKMDF